jgi:hypothetical protein
VRLHFGMCVVLVDNRDCFGGDGEEDSSQDNDEVEEGWIRIVW